MTLIFPCHSDIFITSDNIWVLQQECCNVAEVIADRNPCLLIEGLHAGFKQSLSPEIYFNYEFKIFF